MTDDELVNEILELEAEVKTWGKAPRNLADRTPWQVAVVDRSNDLIAFLLGNKPEPISREEWRKTLPPRTLHHQGE